MAAFRQRTELLDTPGILWPKFEDEEIGKKLALTGAIKDQLVHLDDLRIYGLDFFARYYPGRIAERYNIMEDQEQKLGSELLMDTYPNGAIRMTMNVGVKSSYSTSVKEN